MKTSLFLLPFLTGVALISCSKSGGTSGGGLTGVNDGPDVMPLTTGNVWNYRLKHYNTTTGALTDSSNFTLTATGTMPADGTTYTKLVNSSDNSILWLTNVPGTALESIDSVGGVNYYVWFIGGGAGDST